MTPASPPLLGSNAQRTLLSVSCADPIERTRAGLAAAKRQGRVGGRKRRLTDQKVKAAKQLLFSGTPPREVAQSLGVSVPTSYRRLPASSRT